MLIQLSSMGHQYHSGTLLLAILPGVRLLAAFVLPPVLGGRWKTAGVAGIGAMVILPPAWPHILAQAPIGIHGGPSAATAELLPSMLLLFLGELFIGALLGAICWFIIFSIEGALAHLLGTESYRPVPYSGQRVPPLVQPEGGGNSLVSVLTILLLLLFLWNGGHHVVISSLLNSFQWLPPGSAPGLWQGLSDGGSGGSFSLLMASFLIPFAGQLSSLGLCLLLPGLALLIPVQLISVVISSMVRCGNDDFLAGGFVSIVLSLILCLLLVGFALPVLAELVVDLNGEALGLFQAAMWKG